MIRNIFIISLCSLFLALFIPLAFEQDSLFFSKSAYAEEEKSESEAPEQDEKEYFSNPHYDLEERHFNESERNFDEPEKHDYYERFDEKQSKEYR